MLINGTVGQTVKITADVWPLSTAKVPADATGVITSVENDRSAVWPYRVKVEGYSLPSIIEAANRDCGGILFTEDEVEAI